MLSKDPKIMNEFIIKLFRQNGLEESVIMSEIIKEWNNIFGDNFAKHCFPYKLKNQVLTIKVHSAAWREEIKLRNDKLINLINHRLNKNVVKELKLR
ncbi:MAG TPA: DUF721 domain-containing protein [Candidatus Kapabacteria bacterium]|nr:DUF721 domain-containing protein [Candidatus Kapabacteria bacterium]